MRYYVPWIDSTQYYHEQLPMLCSAKQKISTMEFFFFKRNATIVTKARSKIKSNTRYKIDIEDEKIQFKNIGSECLSENLSDCSGGLHISHSVAISIYILVQYLNEIEPLLH